MNSLLNSTTWILILLSSFASYGRASSTQLSEEQALLWVQEICRQYYVPLGEENQRVWVFIEINTSTEPWTFSAPKLLIKAVDLQCINTSTVTFFDEKEYVKKAAENPPGCRVFRATFFPFAYSRAELRETVIIPVWNGDRQKWRENLFMLRKDGPRNWTLLYED